MHYLLYNLARTPIAELFSDNPIQTDDILTLVRAKVNPHAASVIHVPGVYKVLPGPKKLFHGSGTAGPIILTLSRITDVPEFATNGELQAYVIAWEDGSVMT